jgi:phosphoribosyl 1,2-cyclic phosphodiesterase
VSVFFCVLGSGSRGNAALLVTPDAHVLIDIGFQPDELAARLDGTGASWESLDAVVLTHLHNDHFKRRCLKKCVEHGIAFFCHADHAEQLKVGAARKLREAGLLRTYSHESFDAAGVRFTPVPVPHDCPPTFGFRIEALCARGRVRGLGYFADLGECLPATVGQMHGLDLLALEFNHDEELERASGRSPFLIQRVLGPEGHLSNRQAAEVLRQLLTGGHPPPRTLVQMHLSLDCNRAELAYRAALEVVQEAGAPTQVFSTRQDRRGTMHRVDVEE